MKFATIIFAEITCKSAAASAAKAVLAHSADSCYNNKLQINQQVPSRRSTLESISQILARELGREQNHIDNVIKLIDEGNTIPFIARYRKELHLSLIHI